MSMRMAMGTDTTQPRSSSRTATLRCPTWTISTTGVSWTDVGLSSSVVGCTGGRDGGASTSEFVQRIRFGENSCSSHMPDTSNWSSYPAIWCSSTSPDTPLCIIAETK